MPISRRILKVALLLLLSWCVWLTLAVRYSHDIATVLLPMLRWEMSTIASRYEIKEISIQRIGLESAVKIEVATNLPRKTGSGLFPTGVAMQSSTLVANLTLPLVVMLSVVSTAVLLGFRPIKVLVLPGLCALLVLVMLDVPLVLIAALDEVVQMISVPQGGRLSPLVLWMGFLNGGGRMVLGIATGLLVIVLSRSANERKDGIRQQRHL
jgi:hypothetical protein